jgi:hypothetical protein
MAEAGAMAVAQGSEEAPLDAAAIRRCGPRYPPLPSSFGRVLRPTDLV